MPTAENPRFDINYRESESKPPEKSAWIILDLDGVILRWVKSDLPDQRSQALFYENLIRLRDKNIGISVLTNRPPGAMPSIAYTLGVNYGYWITESGGSIYDVYHHKTVVAPNWINALPRVNKLRETISRNIFPHTEPLTFQDAQFEPGMGPVKTVVIPPFHIPPEKYLNEILLPGLSGFTGDFSFTAGKAVDIDPIGLSKSDGMETLLFINNINPSVTPTVWIADHTRDIAAGVFMVEKGGFVGSVGNATTDYRDFVRKNNGITAPPETAYHESVTRIINEFILNHL
jgi:hypothetical protein